MMMAIRMLQTAPATGEIGARIETSTMGVMTTGIDRDQETGGEIEADRGKGWTRGGIGATRRKGIVEGIKTGQETEDMRSGAEARTGTDHGEVTTYHRQSCLKGPR